MPAGYREKESTLNKNVVKWLNSLPRCMAKKRAGNVANRGQPDITGCINGFRIELEGKIGNNKPTRLQNHWLAKWKAAGAITGVYWSLEDAKKIINDELKNKKTLLNTQY
jgi:hypothetical protein